jgi:hypothetical protein
MYRYVKEEVSLAVYDNASPSDLEIGLVPEGLNRDELALEAKVHQHVLVVRGCHIVWVKERRGLADQKDLTSIKGGGQTSRIIVLVCTIQAPIARPHCTEISRLDSLQEYIESCGASSEC